jgi:ribonuclease HII
MINKNLANLIAQNKVIIGIDEAGRGPLAGRIFVCALLFPKDSKKFLKNKNVPGKLNDSKKLSAKQRLMWFNWIVENKIPFVVSAASSRTIDKTNISYACNMAANRAIKKIIDKYKIKKIEVVCDAGISIKLTSNICCFKSFPKADETVAAVSLASIVAKVKRDLEMIRLDKKYPYFGFLENKGYGTKKHIQAIKKYGLTPIHRKTFIKKIVF